MTLLVGLAPLAAGAAPIAEARASGGQPALAVGFDAAGQLRARACTGAPCSIDGGQVVEVPRDVLPRAAAARLTVAPIGLERHAVIVEFPASGSSGGWAALIVAAPSGAGAQVLFSGPTGFGAGVEGERTASTVVAREGAVYVAKEQEGRTLCGRPALLAPHALDPTTLTLKPAKLQRLGDAERRAAPAITAQPSTAGGARVPLLSALWATSAAPGTSAAALTDGDDRTFWAENRGGVGRGEFVVASSPRELPLDGFEIALSADTGAHAAVPSEIWLATDKETFRVELPPQRTAGARYTVALPARIQSSCVALVLESAAPNGKDAVVRVAELSARAALDAKPDELAEKLQGGGKDAEAAGALLSALGREGAAAVARRFATLDEGGRRVALQVLDDAPCEIALPIYVQALTGSIEAQHLHARSAFARCGADSLAALRGTLSTAQGAARVQLAEELYELSPTDAVSAVLPLLSRGPAEERRAFRALVARGVRHEGVRAALAFALAADGTSRRTRVEILRALGDELPALGSAGAEALRKAFVSETKVSTRFLLLAPAATLAKTDESSRSFLRAALSDGKSPMLRAQAVRVLTDVAPFRAEVERALDDRNVRVREAAAAALGRGAVRGAGPRLATLLRDDRWPLVRVASARAISQLPADPALDDAIRDALSDPSPDVRRESIRSVGVRRVKSAAPDLSETLEDTGEIDTVRAAAALTLGVLCDTSSADLLTRHARRLAKGGADISDHRIGQSAIIALAMIGPGDLGKRLAPMLGKEVHGPVRALAERAMRAPSPCRGRPGRTK